MELSELNLDEEVHEAFELTGKLLEQAAKCKCEVSNPANLIFAAGDYFARKRDEFCQKDPNFMVSEQYSKGCGYIVGLLEELNKK